MHTRPRSCKSTTTSQMHWIWKHLLCVECSLQGLLIHGPEPYNRPTEHSMLSLAVRLIARCDRHAWPSIEKTGFPFVTEHCFSSEHAVTLAWYDRHYTLAENSARRASVTGRWPHSTKATTTVVDLRSSSLLCYVYRRYGKLNGICSRAVYVESIVPCSCFRCLNKD
jgi:hypothetical protein